MSEKPANGAQAAARTKARTNKGLGWDNWLMIGAMVAFGAFVWYRLSNQAQEFGMTQPECDCPKKWDPVCVEIETEEEEEEGEPEIQTKRKGRYKAVARTKKKYLSYPNKCEAECHKFSVWEAGICTDSDAIIQCLYANDCPHMDSSKEMTAVCWYGTTFPHQCYGNCVVQSKFPSVTFDIADTTEGACKDPCKKNDCSRLAEECVERRGKCFEEPCKPFRCVKRECPCEKKWDPVCVKGVTWASECFAKCDDKDVNAVPGECKIKDPFNPNPRPFSKEVALSKDKPDPQSSRRPPAKREDDTPQKPRSLPKFS